MMMRELNSAAIERTAGGNEPERRLRTVTVTGKKIDPPIGVPRGDESNLIDAQAIVDGSVFELNPSVSAQSNNNSNTVIVLPPGVADMPGSVFDLTGVEFDRFETTPLGIFGVDIDSNRVFLDEDRDGRWDEVTVTAEDGSRATFAR